jgi:chemotaxis protein histidine kinase CheA
MKYHSQRVILGIQLVFCLVFCARAYAGEPIKLDSINESFAIGTVADYLVDESKKLTFEQITQGDAAQKFVPHKKSIPNFGMTGHAYWFRFAAQNALPQDFTWLLGVEYALLDYIDVYYKDHSGAWVKKSSGDRFVFDEREIKNRHFYFQIPFSPGEAREFYVRVQSEGSAEIPLFFKSTIRYAADDHESQLIQGAFAGFLLIFILYYVALGLGSRTREYYFYALFLTAHLVFKGTMNGVTFEYFWPNFIEWANKASLFSTPFVFFTATMFSYAFLPVQQYRKYRIALLCSIVILGCCVAGSFFLPYKFIKLFTILGMSSVPLMIAAASYMLKQGFGPAKYFLLSWVALLTGSIVYGMQKLGVIGVSWTTLNIVEITTAMQAVLLSIGQSAKIADINRAIIKTQKESLNTQMELNRLTSEMNQKLEKLVNERTADLWKKTKDVSVMMDNITQGICTFGDQLTIHPEYSKHLEVILGQEHLVDSSLESMLFNKSNLKADTRAMLRSAVQSCIGEDLISFELNGHIFPRQLEINENGAMRYLEMDWAAIENQQNQIDKIMVAIRDVTEVRAMEEKARNKEKELELIGQILHLNTAKFNKFIESAMTLVTSARQCLQKTPVTAAVWRVILRDIHTIKGNSRTYGFADLTAKVHAVEEYLFSVNKENITDEVVQKSLICLDEIQEIVFRYKEINDVKLERGENTAAEKALVEAGIILRELQATGQMFAHHSTHDIHKLLGLIDELTTDSFEKAIQPVIESLPSLAKQLNKEVPIFKIAGDNFNVSKAMGNKFEDIFVHIIRNSMDHGFIAGQQGKITVNVTVEKEKILIVYADNGRGLNLLRLREKGLQMKLISEKASPEEIGNLIFESGVSSAEKVTDLSGRGVGMDAVQAFVGDLEGKISLVLLEDEDLGFRKFEFVIQIPNRQAVQISSEKEREFAIIGQILRVNTAKFEKFINSAMDLTTECEAILARVPITPEQRLVLLRDLHTIKGNARTYSFIDLTEKLHTMEEFLLSMEGSDFSDGFVSNVKSQLKELREMLSLYKEINDVKLERAETHHIEKTLLDAGTILGELQESGTLSSYSRSSEVRRLLTTIAELTTDTFERSIKPVVDSLPSLARQLGKPAPLCRLQGGEVIIGRHLGGKFDNIFVHLMRNSLDHGFQGADVGIIDIKLEVRGDRLLICYRDNGRGLALQTIRDKGLEKCLIRSDASDEEVASLIFRSGLSTASRVTDLSGRGLGLDVVHDLVNELSGEIKLFLLEGAGDGYRPFEFVISLPYHPPGALLAAA